MGLPCRHLFKARTVLGMSQFDASLVSKRWTIEYCITAIKVGESGNISHTEKDDKGKIGLTQAQKFRKAIKLA